jgi:HK97 family phage major capsid protein
MENNILNDVASEMNEELRNADVLETAAEEVRSEEVTVDTVEEVTEEVTTEEVAEQAEPTLEVSNEIRSAINNSPKNMDTINNLQARFSLAKAIKDTVNGVALTGAELEASQEARSQAAANGVQLSGQIAMPSEFRDTMVAESTSPGTVVTNGSIFDDGQSIVSNLRPNTVFSRLGATYFRNATGPVVIPVQTANHAATELGEYADATASNIALTQVTLNPQRIAASTSYSRQLLAQSDAGLEQFIMNDLNREMGLQQDEYLIAKLYAALTATDGTGVAVEEVPYLMEETLRLADANADAAKFAIDPSTNRRLRRAAVGAGSGLFAGTNESTIGYSNVVSTMFNADDAIMGDFSDFVVAEWGGVDVIVDPYTGAAKDVINVTANTYLDGIVRRAGSFTRTNNIGA